MSFWSSKLEEALQEESTERQRSFTVVANTNSLIEQSLALKQKPNIQSLNIKLKGKEQYQKQPYCTVCFRPFTANKRQHHCRVCANAICDNCSQGKVNSERACEVCYLRLSNTAEQQRKRTYLNLLELKCALLLRQKFSLIITLDKLKSTPTEEPELGKQAVYKAQDELIGKLEQELREQEKKKEDSRRELEAIKKEKAEVGKHIESVNEELAELEKGGGGAD